MRVNHALWGTPPGGVGAASALRPGHVTEPQPYPALAGESSWLALESFKESARAGVSRAEPRPTRSQLRPFPILSGQRKEARILCDFHVPSILHVHRWRAFPIQDKAKDQDLGVSLHSGSTVVQACRERTSFLLLSGSSLKQPVRLLCDMIQVISPL